jgi:transcriptional regulator with XRE-family HTH domain
MTIERRCCEEAWFDLRAFDPLSDTAIMNAKLKIFLAQTGRRQYQIAREAGLSENELSRIVRGRRSPTPDERKKLALVLGVAEPELF